jgi:signal transduction histidine kinase
VLLDIMMPDMDGYQVCDALKADERTREIPIIFISALDAVADKVKGFEKGAVDFVTKPFQAQEVLARVRTHLILRGLQRRLQAKNARLKQEIVQRTRAEAELREANASKDKFFSIIAHDLRSPFNVLISLTEVLFKDFDQYSPEFLKKNVERVHTSSKQLYSLLTNLLEWSRLERGVLVCEPARLLLSELTDLVIHLLLETAEQKQITIRNRIPQGTYGYADLNMVKTILRNLLSNALKFTENGGSIEVTSQMLADGVVEIAVTDTGVGIAPEKHADLFRIDVKTSRPGTAGEKGTGLGLVLCKDLIEKNGGSIWIESEEGKGSAFRFTLPATLPTQQQ